MAAELTTKCRTCMQDDMASYHLYDLYEEQTIMEILDAVVPQIHIMEECPLSNFICQQCVDKLLIAYKFQKLCIDTNNQLRNQMVGITSREAADSERIDCWQSVTGEKGLPIKFELDNEDMCYFEINTEQQEHISENGLQRGGENGTDDNSTHVRPSRRSKRNCLKKFKTLQNCDDNFLLLQRCHTHKTGLESKYDCAKGKGPSSLKEHRSSAHRLTEKNKLAHPQARAKEKFQCTPQRFKEPIPKIGNISVDTEPEIYNNSYCLKRGECNQKSSSKTFDNDKTLIVPLFEDAEEIVIKCDSDISIPQEKVSRKRAKKLTPQILHWIELFARDNPRITIKNMQRKLFEEKNTTLSLSTIYCGMRKLKSKKRIQHSENENNLSQSDEDSVPSKIPQLTDINMDKARSVIAQYRQKFEALKERKRPKKLTPEILELIAFFARGNRRITTKTMRKELLEKKNIELSLSTIYCGMRVLRVGVGGAI